MRRPRSDFRPGLVVAAIICGAAFAGVSAVALTGASDSLDTAGHEHARAVGLDHPALLSTLAALTQLGASLTVAGIDLVVLIVCLVRGRRAAAVFVVAAAVLSGGISSALRYGLGRVRPTDQFWAIHAPSYPSGHATNSVATALIILILCWPLLSRLGRVAVTAVAAGYVGVVGLSRVVGGVHWPTDVLGGWLLAATLTTACAAVAFRRPPPATPSAPPPVPRPR